MNIRDLLPFLKLCLDFLNKKEKISTFFIAYLLLFSSILEMLSLISIMPFIAFIINPKVIFEHNLYQSFEKIFGVFNESELVFIFGFGAILLLLFSLFLSFYIQHYVRIFVVKCQNRLTEDIINETIVAPYIWFLNQNSTSKTHYLQNDILMWAQYGLLKIMQMMGSITLLFVASITFLFISPLIGILIIFFVLFCSFLILNFTKSKISKFAEIKRNSSTGSITSLNQIFRGIKDIRVSKSEDYFKKKYLNNFYVYGSSGIKLNFFQNISPIIIMALGQTGIIIIAIILWASNYSGSEIASIMAISF